MRWSYSDLLGTPAPVVEEVVRWMHDLAEEQQRAAREASGRRR